MTDPNRALRVGSSAPWAKGRPRNDTPADWPQVKRRLLARLKNVKPGIRPPGPDYSRAALARLLGLSESAVRRWLLPAGHPQRTSPSSATVDLIREWLR